MRRWFSGIAAGLVFTLAAGGQGPGGDADQGGSPRRLFYAFSPQVPEHCSRAHLLQRLNPSCGQWLQITGIVRGDPGSGGLEALRCRFGLSYPLLAPEAVAADPGLPAELKAPGGGAGDYVLLLDGSGRTLAGGPGEGLAPLLAGLAREILSTDVDDSTWGKIKELFQ
jgi:hypothetical protein